MVGEGSNAGSHHCIKTNNSDWNSIIIHNHTELRIIQPYEEEIALFIKVLISMYLIQSSEKCIVFAANLSDSYGMLLMSNLKHFFSSSSSSTLKADQSLHMLWSVHCQLNKPQELYFLQAVHWNGSGEHKL